MPQKRKRPTSKKAQNTKSAPTRRGASSVVRVAPSMSGKLRVVSDDRTLEQEEAQQVTTVIQDQVTAAPQLTPDRSFGFDGMFNPYDVEDEGISASMQQAESASPFAYQDASAFSRSSDTYSAHKKHAASSSSSRTKPSKRSASMSNTRVRGAEQTYATAGFDAVDAAENSYQDADTNTTRASSRKKKPHKWTATRIVMLIFALLLVAALAVGGLLFWDRFLRYDDAADFQGTWYYQEGAVEVTVDETHIHLPEDLHYAYTLDTWAKTISLSFADLTGGGSYEFSEDRSSIVIREGEGSDATSLTLVKALDSSGEGIAPEASTQGNETTSDPDGTEASDTADDNSGSSESADNA